MDADIKENTNFNMYAQKGEEYRGYLAVDDEFMEEQFEKLLSETQNMILRILKENFTLSEISDFVGLSQEEVIKKVKVIADKRKLFFENV